MDDGFDLGIRKFFEINELSAQHASEEKRQLAGHEDAKRTFQDEALQKLREYLSLDSVPDLHAVVEELHKKATFMAVRELEQKQEKERAALKKKHEEIERQRWDQVVEADLPADLPADMRMPTNVSPLGTAPRPSVLAKPTAAPLPSLAYSVPPAPVAHKQGPLMAPAVSGEMRGYGSLSSPDPTRHHGALPIISHIPSQGPLGYPMHSRQPSQDHPTQRPREGSIPGSHPSANHGPVVAYPQSAPQRAYQSMPQARVDIAPRPNPYANHPVPPQIQQPPTNVRRPLPHERYAGNHDPRASAPPTHWHPPNQAVQPMHSPTAHGYASAPPPSVMATFAATDVIDTRSRLTSQSPANPAGRDPGPIMGTQMPRPIQPDSSSMKRKVANGDDIAIDGSSKRPKHDGHANGIDSHRSTSKIRLKPADRTIPFDEVYKDGNPEYKHIIIQFPDAGDFYILRCDEHGVHFGEHPLRGAAKHLASAQHGRMSKEHSKAVETLGCLVADCTPERMEVNNKMVLKAFQEGYKPFNANQLSKTARAMKGYPQLDKQGLPIPGTIQRLPKKFSGIFRAKPCELYVAVHPEEKKSYPAIVLPWTDPDLSAVGIGMTFEDVGLFQVTLPKCFDYVLEGDSVKGVKGWAAGFQDGGVYVKQREFPGVYIVDEDPQKWIFGWIEASNLSHFDFDDARRADLPGFDAAREYYATNVKKFQSWADMQTQSRASAAQQPSFSESSGLSAAIRSGRQPLPTSRPIKDKDVEMVDVGNNDDSDQESDQGSSGKSTTNSDNDVDMANVDSRRTSVSNRDESSTAKLIATQALSLQSPTLTAVSAPPEPAPVPRPGFVAVNSPGFVAVNSRSAASSPGPGVRQGSVPHQNPERRRVEKIHASSKNPYRVNHNLATPLTTASGSNGTLQPQASQASPAIAVRKPSPASLQHILHDTDSPAEAPAMPSTDSRQPTASPQSLSSIVVKTTVQSVSRLDRAESVPVPQSMPGERDFDLPRSTSLTPAPLSTPTTPAFVNGTNGRLQLPSVQPLPSQHQYPTPLPSATESVTGRTPLPVIGFPRAKELSPAQSDMATPTVSVINSRSNSPAAVALASVKSEAGSGLDLEGDVFALAKIQVGGADLFVATSPAQQLALVDDHRSGLLKTTDDAPEELRSFTIDPKLIKSATRVHDKSTDCNVDIELNDGKKIKLVFETTKLENSRMENGRVQARRFCRRLMAWNKLVECPSVVLEL